jgi:hypothetical protein
MSLCGVKNTIGFPGRYLMSISFVVRKNKIMIGMNYDSGDTIWKLSDLGLSHLTVLVKYFGGWVPAFGVREDGTFINEVRVDPLPEPEQKHPSDKVWTTRKLVESVLRSEEKIPELLNRIEVINAPEVSMHNMIVCPSGDVYAVEPGRRIIASPREESPFFLMANFPLSRYKGAGTGLTEIKLSQPVNSAFAARTPAGNTGGERYETVRKLLLELPEDYQVTDVFPALDASLETYSDRRTTLSMLAVPEDGVVYFRVSGQDSRILTYYFADGVVKNDLSTSSSDVRAWHLSAEGMGPKEIYERWR